MIKFKDDAANAPDVTRMRPSQLEDDFRRSIVTRRHDRRVMLPLERRRPEVDQLDASVSHASHRLLDDGRRRRSRRNCDALDVPVVGHEEDVFRLEVGVSQLVVVHELDRVAQLVGDVTNLLERVGDV